MQSHHGRNSILWECEEKLSFWVSEAILRVESEIIRLNHINYSEYKLKRCFSREIKSNFQLWRRMSSFGRVQEIPFYHTRSFTEVWQWVNQLVSKWIHKHSHTHARAISHTIHNCIDGIEGVVYFLWFSFWLLIYITYIERKFMNETNAKKILIEMDESFFMY